MPGIQVRKQSLIGNHGDGNSHANCVWFAMIQGNWTNSKCKGKPRFRRKEAEGDRILVKAVIVRKMRVNNGRDSTPFAQRKFWPVFYS